ncbi:hypothetical protein AWC01_13170 [Mycobacterium doricum]|uniref:Uncharacterized protein n=1 Tax=Mycolicibacterium doricum TaxID=126673 RepID=A0A1X1T482_9MYCO|nr:hypothetical protein AWC01_13170 [Mycolicibacterium doricum]
MQEFSAVEVWALAVAVVSLASDWLIPTIQHFIEIRRQSQGWTTSEAEALPLKVSIAKLDMNAGISETYELEGSGADVMDALNLLSKGDQRRLTDDLEE